MMQVAQRVNYQFLIIVMGQVVGKVSDIFRCNLRAIQTGGSKVNTILAADEVWLVDTTNSLTNSLSGNCDAYIVGDGSTKASALELKKISAVNDTDITPMYDTDLSLIDDAGYSIVDFLGGHIQTKNFNSAETPKQETPSEGDADFAICDEDENCIAVFEDGHIRTKNFNSKDIEPIEVTELKTLVEKYKGKRISILGDSISTFGTPSATNEDGVYCYSYYPTATCRYSEDGVDSIAFDVQNTWWMQLINRLGATLGINESWRGTKVAGTGSSAFNSQTRINHLGENGTPNLIIVFGGTNDAGNSVTIGTFDGGVYADYNTEEEIAALPVSTFADAYKAMLIRLMYTYPTAEIVCLLPTFTTSYYTIAALDNYVEVIKEACDFFGIKWIDVRVSGITIFNKSSYLVDGIHPNVAGMTLLANKIYKHLIFD